MNVEKPAAAQFVNAACDRTWTCPCCFRTFSNIAPGRAICQHCGQESELTSETQPVCISTIVDSGRQGVAHD